MEAIRGELLSELNEATGDRGGSCCCCWAGCGRGTNAEAKSSRPPPPPTGRQAGGRVERPELGWAEGGCQGGWVGGVRPSRQARRSTEERGREGRARRVSDRQAVLGRLGGHGG